MDARAELRTGHWRCLSRPSRKHEPRLCNAESRRRFSRKAGILIPPWDGGSFNPVSQTLSSRVNGTTLRMLPINGTSVAEHRIICANRTGSYQQAFEREKKWLIPVPATKGKETLLVDRDGVPEHHDEKPAIEARFRANGTVTAGNSSGINDDDRLPDCCVKK